MPEASVKRLIECNKDQLIDLVLDIEKYPEFVPFCLDAHVYERNNEGDAVDQLDTIEIQLEAMNVAKNMDIDQAEAIVRTEIGSRVSKMSTKEVKRDLMVFAKNNPNLFLELAHDENINIRNIGIKAVEMKIIKLSNDQITV